MNRSTILPRVPRGALGAAMGVLLSVACGSASDNVAETTQQATSGGGNDAVASFVADFRVLLTSGDISKADAFVVRAKTLAASLTDEPLRARVLEVASETQLWLAALTKDPAVGKNYRTVANGDAQLVLNRVRAGSQDARVLTNPPASNPLANDAVGMIQLGGAMARSADAKEAEKGKALLKDGLATLDLVVEHFPEGGLLLRSVIRAATAKPDADSLAPSLSDARKLFESCLKKPLASRDKFAISEDELRQLERIALTSHASAPDGFGHAADRSRAVCASTPIAPHATENQLLLIGDILVKAGRLEEANGLYDLATKATSFDGWSFRDLAQKRRTLVGGIVSGRIPNPGFEVLAKTAIMGEGACNACHQTH